MQDASPTHILRKRMTFHHESPKILGFELKIGSSKNNLISTILVCLPPIGSNGHEEGCLWRISPAKFSPRVPWVF
jgi:hypothetical protein